MKLRPNPTSLRAFLGVSLPLDLCRKVAGFQQELQNSLPTVNWVRPESIHLTLKFLGNMTPPMVERLLAAIEPVRKHQAPLTLQVQGLGVFPDVRHPRILWTGCTGDIPSLLTMVTQIEQALEPLGFSPEEKPYHPHLTLARIRHDSSKVGGRLRQSGLLEQSQDLGVLPIERITLFRSDLSRSGAEYTPLWAVSLNKDQSNSSTSR
jgi:RNA 2',3'-cyclic 3'-phosphodiesterase